MSSGIAAIVDKLIDGKAWNDMEVLAPIFLSVSTVSFLGFAYLFGLGLDNCCYSECGRKSRCYRPVTLFHEMMRTEPNRRSCCAHIGRRNDSPTAVADFPPYYSTPLHEGIHQLSQFETGSPDARENRHHICSAEEY